MVPWREREIYIPPSYIPVSFRPCVWPLKRNASWRWPRRNAKALKPRWACHRWETGRVDYADGWCNDMSKMGGNITGSWMVCFRILTCVLVLLVWETITTGFFIGGTLSRYLDMCQIRLFFTNYPVIFTFFCRLPNCLPKKRGGCKKLGWKESKL